MLPHVNKGGICALPGCPLPVPINPHPSPPGRERPGAFSLWTVTSPSPFPPHPWAVSLVFRGRFGGLGCWRGATQSSGCEANVGQPSVPAKPALQMFDVTPWMGVRAALGDPRPGGGESGCGKGMQCRLELGWESISLSQRRLML